MRPIRVMLCLGLIMGHVGLAFAAPNAYVLDFLGKVAILDTTPNTLLPNTLNVGKEAWSVAVSPDGSRVYTYNTGIPPAGQITIINAANNTIITQVPVGCTNDSWITISPDGAFLYIACNPTGNIVVFDTASNSVTTSVPIAGGVFSDLVTNQTGARLYVADHGTR
jgi:DNA-binding beta-propeller fold protein YncE